MELSFECLCTFFAFSTLLYSFFLDNQGSLTPILWLEAKRSLEEQLCWHQVQRKLLVLPIQ